MLVILVVTDCSCCCSSTNKQSCTCEDGNFFLVSLEKGGIGGGCGGSGSNVIEIRCHEELYVKLVFDWFFVLLMDRRIILWDREISIWAPSQFGSIQWCAYGSGSGGCFIVQDVHTELCCFVEWIPCN